MTFQAAQDSIPLQSPGSAVADSATGILSGMWARVDALGSGEWLVIQSLASIILIVLVRWVVLFVVRKRVSDPRRRYNWRKGTAYLAAVLALFVVGPLWFGEWHTLATFLGLVAAGVAVALKDPVMDMAGWLFILWRRPFVVGDRVQVGAHAGDVIDLRLFQFTLLEIGNWVHADQSTGRLVHVPNGRVFQEPLANYTRGFPFIWNEIPVRVTFESQWRDAKDILLGIVQRRAALPEEEARRQILQASRRFMILYSNLTPTVYTTADDSGIVLTARYLCEARKRRGTTEEIWEDLLTAFSERDDIALAYPTQRFFLGREGPSGGAGPGPGTAGNGPGPSDGPGAGGAP